MSDGRLRLMRAVAGIAAAVALGAAIYVAADVADVMLRPANQGWIEILALLLLPHFVAVVLLGAVGAVLGRFAWMGSLSGKA